MPLDATHARRGRPRLKPAPPLSRKKLLDAARAEAILAACGPQGSSGLFPAECGSLSGARWFCVLSKPHAEREAAQELRNQGFAVFLPMEVVWRGHHGDRKPTARPCVPRYLFVRFNPHADRWRVIWSTRGVSKLISFAPEVPAPCRAGEVERVWATVYEPLSQVDPTAPRLDVGQRGKVASGPFSAFPGEVMRVEEDGRIVVSVTIFGRATPITLEPEQFKAAK